MTTTTPNTTGKSSSKGYKDLIIWQRSMDLVIFMYMLTSNFPEAERQGLTAQIRSCVTRIPVSIAVGSKVGTRNNFRFGILEACSICTELELLVDITHRLGYITEKEHQAARGQFINLFGMLYKFAAALKVDKKAAAKND